jgi:hypothetical protein
VEVIILERDHTSMEAAGRAIHAEGGEFRLSADRLGTQLERFIPYFGNPSSDEAARVFRQGEEGHPGFDHAHEDLSKALTNLSEAYQAIGAAVVTISKNTKAADLASMIDKNAFVRDLLTFAERENDDIGVPTTSVERA